MSCAGRSARAVAARAALADVLTALAVLVVGALLFVGCEGRGDGSARGRAQIEASMAALHASPVDARSVWLRVSPRGMRELPTLVARGTTEASATNAGTNAGTNASGVPTPSAPERVALSRTRSGDFTVCTGGQCGLALTLADAHATAGTNGRVGVGVSARVRSDPIGVRYEQSWACAFASRAECTVTVDTEREGAPFLGVEATLGVAVDPPTGMTAVSLVDAGVPTGLDGGDVSVEGTNVCGAVWCTVANVTGATSLVASRMNDELVARVRDEVRAQVCRACDAGCPRGARCEAGVCMAGPSCVPRAFAAETTLAAADAQTEVLLAAALADEAEVRAGGVELALRLTAIASGRSRCAPRAPAPAPGPLPRGVLDVAPTDRGHVRIAVGEAALARALHALQQGGVGCKTVALDDVPIVGQAGLVGLFPTASRLAALAPHGAKLVVMPLAPPTIETTEDGALTLGTSIRVDVEAELLGRTVRVASAALALSARAHVAMHEGTLALEMPSAEREMRVAHVWSSPVLGASDAMLRQSFEAIGAVAATVLPETTPLEALPLPGGHLRLVGPPLRAEARGARALVLDLELSP